MTDHIANQITHPLLNGDSTLHVVGVISNPARYHSRYRLAREWIKRMESYPNVTPYMVETAFGDRAFEVTDSNNPRHLQLRTNSEIWIKENMINLGIRHLLPARWKYVAWVDCDVEFRNNNWALDSIHQLQHYPIIQPWQSAVNLGPTGNISKSFDSVGFKIHKGIPAMDSKTRYSGDPYKVGHPGYAWAATRAFFENVGGLIDFAILGSADHHMALGCRGIYSHSVHSMMSGNFMRLCHEWQSRAMRLSHGIVGFTNGRIEHHFHGPMERRNYVGRWEILIKNNFDPVKDLMHDHQGMIQLVGKPALEHDIRMYNRNRFEDSIEEY